MSSLYRKGWWPSKVIPTLCDPGDPGPEYPGHTSQKLLHTSKNDQNWNPREPWQWSFWVDSKELVTTTRVEIPAPQSGQYPHIGWEAWLLLRFFFCWLYLNFMNQRYLLSKIKFSYWYITSQLVTWTWTENMHFIILFWCDHWLHRY